MVEIQEKKPRPSLLAWAIGGVVLIGVAAVLYVIVGAAFKPSQPTDLKAFARGELAKLEVHATPRPAPAVPFLDPDGKPMTVADLKGRVVVLNLWATWCAPCKLEMPTLARLQAAYQVQPVSVLAVSVDRDDDLDVARADIAAVPPLKLYRDQGYKLSFGLEPKAQGFPTTIVFDKQGKERARLSGDADWASPEARGLIEALLKE